MRSTLLRSVVVGAAVLGLAGGAAASAQALDDNHTAVSKKNWDLDWTKTTKVWDQDRYYNKSIFFGDMNFGEKFDLGE